MRNSNDLSRRRFLKSAAALAAPLILPRRVLGMQGKPGANDRVLTGLIGCGGMGGGHLQQFGDSIIALCDADQSHLDGAAQRLGRRAFACKDYRELLERQDVDAVIIATPDHWHGVMAVHACEAGKDVYVEKPSSKTIEEGRAMIAAARQYGRVVQVGSQGRSTADAHAACTYIRNGQIGDVNRVDCWHTVNPTGGDLAKFGAPPAELDWDLWLGPARWRPFNPDYCHFNFRWMLDFGAGSIRDRGAHVLSVVSWCLDLDNAFPVKVTASGEPPKGGLWDVPTTFTATWEFENPARTIVWAQPGVKAADHDFGVVFTGSKDTLIVRGGDGGCYTENKALAYSPAANGVHMFKSPGHARNFIDCVKSRGKPVMDIEIGHRIAVLCILAELSYRLGRPLQFDGATQTFPGDAEANRMLGNPGRGAWHV